MRTNEDDKQKQLRRAQHIKKTLGTRAAARYMVKRGWSIEATRYVMEELFAGAAVNTRHINTREYLK